MEACFACHGMQHGPQGELAGGECSDCHTPTHQLRPATHTKKWASKPHADAANGDVNACMMCHVASEDCDECHREKEVDVTAMPNVYHPVVHPQPSGPSFEIDLDAPVSMSQCQYCHPDLDAFPSDRLTFVHAPHIGRNYRCEACHPEFAHSQTGTQIPDMLSCYRCHDAYHSAGGLIAEGEDCVLCHPKSFDLEPTDHTKKFVRGGHKKNYRSSPESCSMCHESKSCVECHSGESKSPGAPQQAVIPASHKKPAWRQEHGGLYLQQGSDCGICHDGPSCQVCHKTVVPHPSGLGREARIGRRSHER